MCGFVAIFRRSRAPVDLATLDVMTDRMAHRGPDGRGTFVAPGCGLGHRRLAIIDLDGGAQPLSGRDERLQIAFNGEVYNYQDVRKSLAGPWRTNSDTEVFLRAYEDRGLAGLTDLVGMWGAAIWDGREERLVVVRDRLGVKPVYYAELPDGFAFASEVRALLEHPEVKRTLDPIALDMLLTYRFVPAPRTLLAGVKKLAPGCAALVGQDGLRIERYWNPVPAPRAISDEDAIAEFSFAFDQAVESRMVSDVPVGVFLSGGIDSAGVLQAAHTPSMDTFTIGFDGSGDDDEIPLAAETAAGFGAAHSSLRIGPEDYARFFDAYVERLEEPVLNDSAMAVHYLSEFARKTVKVVLSGQGADEPLGGYDRYKGEMLSPLYRMLPLRRLLTPIVERSRVGERFKRAVRSLGEEDDIARALRIYAVFQHEEKSGLLTDSMLSAVDGHDVAAPLRPYHAEAAGLSPIGRMLYTDTRLWLVDDLLLVADKLSMAHGLELRVPFLDHRLIELIESFPDAMKLRLGRTGIETKWVHRQAMRRRMPRSILARKKRGFTNPMDAWLRTELAEMVQTRLLGDAPLHQYVRKDAVARLFEEHKQLHDRRRQLFLLLGLDAWLRVYL